MSTPGWYPDPSDPSRQRYFDGSKWTEQYANFGAQAQSVSPQARSGMSKGVRIGLGVGAAVVALAALGSIGNTDKTSRSSTEVNLPGVGDLIPTPKRGTPAQENAIKSAESYLNLSGWSKEGLIGQLVNGAHFSKADATYAVNYLESNGDVNWNEQAVKSAKSYLGLSGWSLEGLINQLVNGAKFTQAQAEYGARIAYAS